MITLACACQSKSPSAAAAATQALPKGMVGVWQFSPAYVEAAAKAAPTLSRMPGEPAARANVNVAAMRLEVTQDGRMRLLQPTNAGAPKLTEMTYTVTRLRDGAATLAVSTPGQSAETMTLVREDAGLRVLRAGQPADQRDILVPAAVQKLVAPAPVTAPASAPALAPASADVKPGQ